MQDLYDLRHINPINQTPHGIAFGTGIWSNPAHATFVDIRRPSHPRLTRGRHTRHMSEIEAHEQHARLHHAQFLQARINKAREHNNHVSYVHQQYHPQHHTSAHPNCAPHPENFFFY
eukprot:TRINITY_DN949_c0_g1_i1.p2 TRINITY_DN949_c0_g1~~TRINITY_DN949_c0_g1_i1.p2  ORF type:complete len:117 (-),score=18.17 TRINITY_DN949_c0_g1_i1:186-536(-)